MADDAIPTEGSSASVSQEAGIAGADTSTKQDGGAAQRLSQALNGLASSLMVSLQEFQDVGNALELEIAARIENGSPNEPQTRGSVETRPALLAVATTLEEIVETFLADIKSNPEVQRLLPAIQKAPGEERQAVFQDLVMSEQPSEETPSTSQLVCKHSCKHHPEIIDPWLWRRLPQEMVELVFANLPLPQIIHLCNYYPAWTAMLKSPSFAEVCSNRHLKLFGLLGYDEDIDYIEMRMYDTESREWLRMKLAGFPGNLNSNASHSEREAYRSAVCVCDGGLVCFVPEEDLTSYPILVCNPLTSNWKPLPVLPRDEFEKKKITMVQLVMEDDGRYKVILVCFEKASEEPFSAWFYDSVDGTWSSMKSGLVYGSNKRVDGVLRQPYVFDCFSKTLISVSPCAALEGVDPFTFAVTSDRIFVLHEPIEIVEREQRDLYHVSKYKLELNRANLSASDLKKLAVLKSPVQVFSDPYKEVLFASSDFVLVFVVNCEDWAEYQHQVVGLYDVEEDEWDVPPPFPPNSNTHFLQLQTLLLCDLRWDATP